MEEKHFAEQMQEHVEFLPVEWRSELALDGGETVARPQLLLSHITQTPSISLLSTSTHTVLMNNIKTFAFTLVAAVQMKQSKQ